MSRKILMCAREFPHATPLAGAGQRNLVEDEQAAKVRLELSCDEQEQLQRENADVAKAIRRNRT